MIEDKIQVLRQAAKVSTQHSSAEVWCVIAGNEELVNNVAYSAIASKDRVKILFREHVTLQESFVQKKFDFIMLNGDTNKIREFSYLCKENGGACVQIAPYYVSNEPNLMLLVAPEDNIKKFVGDVERANAKFSILLEDETTGFIETDLRMSKRLPSFIKTMVSPLFTMSDLILSAILISTEEEKNVETIQEIAKSNQIFVIDFKDIKNDS
ncbi:hypothetical protein [Methanobrevibacter filiformis]|uniref:Uncharacterized protein n=1 Tax=Methanobrevibacter filiformis TaxID=55758 RepID=A0A166FBF1_9EURY|nr:hypothetical protein [Methanobrevibacter filiformis]KZX17498.1 hypothetical protein MBFIL_01090 [Methanobrevibacter filiformis]